MYTYPRLLAVIFLMGLVACGQKPESAATVSPAQST